MKEDKSALKISDGRCGSVLGLRFEVFGFKVFGFWSWVFVYVLWTPRLVNSAQARNLPITLHNQDEVISMPFARSGHMVQNHASPHTSCTVACSRLSVSEDDQKRERATSRIRERKRDQGCLPFTKTIWLEISGINIKQLNAKLRE